MNALITGGYGKIGGAVWHHLRDRGWTVYAPPHDAMWVEYAKHVRRYLDGLPGLDLVVCAHGLYGEVSPLAESESDMWREAIAVNLVGTYNVCRYAIPKMSVGQIILMAGGGGMLNALPLLSSYACSKAGIVSLTATLAAELAGRIRVNCIFPGMQDSKIHDALLDAGREGNPHYDAIKAMRETGEGAVSVDNTLYLIDCLLANEENGVRYFAREYNQRAA